jgi:hypothetical protein
LIYLAEGDKINAGLSAAAMIPVVGVGATAGKAAKKVVGVVGDATGQVTKHADDIVEAGQEVAKHKKLAVQESVENSELHLTKIGRPPRHHVFPQEHRQWFADRGIDIDKYTIELDQGVHTAIHSRGWSEKLMERLTNKEKELGRKLNVREIWDIMDSLRREFKLPDDFIHY